MWALGHACLPFPHALTAAQYMVTWAMTASPSRMRWRLRGPNGLSAYYEADDLRAFDGQALRAQVHGILAGAGVKGAGRLADVIIRRLRR